MTDSPSFKAPATATPQTEIQDVVWTQNDPAAPDYGNFLDLKAVTKIVGDDITTKNWIPLLDGTLDTSEPTSEFELVDGIVKEERVIVQFAAALMDNVEGPDETQLGAVPTEWTHYAEITLNSQNPDVTGILWTVAVEDADFGARTLSTDPTVGLFGERENLDTTIRLLTQGDISRFRFKVLGADGLVWGAAPGGAVRLDISYWNGLPQDSGNV